MTPLGALLAVTACVAAAALLTAASGSAKTVAAKQTLTFYSVITRAQFLNNADDRQRAIINNPFTTNTKKLMTIMKGREKNTGPLPGDTALYSYTLYTDRGLTKKIGTAVYTCDYAFYGKATCTSYFELDGGVLMASGRTRYTDTKYNFSVRGGTYKYLGSRGELVDVPVAKAQNARHLSFKLLG